MKKFIVFIVMIMVITLTACTPANNVVCGEGTVKIDGKCEVDIVDCDEGYHNVEGVCEVNEVEEVTCNAGQHEVNGVCVVEEVTCSSGQHDDNGVCIVDELTCDDGHHEEFGQCVIDVELDIPDWFDGWRIIDEPVGNKDITDLEFTETGFSVYLSGDSRVGIQLTNVVLESGFYYDLQFDYSSTVAGKGIFVQLQGHGGYVFTNPGVMANETVERFSQVLSFPPGSNGTTEGWMTIELLPSTAGEVTIENIELIKTALPTCANNEIIKGIICVVDNNGYSPNGTPTGWFTGWEILTVPGGDKDISDYEFSETGYTTYLDQGQRTGIQMMDYGFESGYTYELSFDYTASEAGRMIWVQMEALGGYGFTNTETWSVSGTGTFTQTLEIPSTYVPSELGWIKLELTPGALDNVTIENIVITKIAN